VNCFLYSGAHIEDGGFLVDANLKIVRTQLGFLMASSSIYDSPLPLLFYQLDGLSANNFFERQIASSHQKLFSH
jgi:hypothetical protein